MQPTKQLLFGDEARKKMLSGISQLAKAVTTTLGPKGRNVALDKVWGAPNVIHDGVTVAKEIYLEDKFENMGAQLVKEAASKTNDNAGDGTTTSTLLAWKMAELGMKHVESGTNPMIMKKGIDRAVKIVVEGIRKEAKEVKKSDWKKVATISAQNEEVGEKIAEALELVGKDGIVEVEAGKTMEIEIKHKEGMEFDKGYVSPYFVTDAEHMEAVTEEPFILITDYRISTIKEILPILEKVLNAGKALVIISSEIEGGVLTTLVMNKLKKGLKILPVKAPQFGDMRKAILEDIASLTGGTVISEGSGKELKNTTLEDLGRSDSVRATKDSTRIVGGRGTKEAVEKRMAHLDTQIKKAKSEFDAEKLKARKAKLAGGVAVIQVGASTEVEMTNLVERVKDAKEATKAAIESGIIPGGGTLFLKASRDIGKLPLVEGDEGMGFSLVQDVLLEPIKLLAKNSGEDPNKVLKKCMDTGKGFNALTGKFEDLEKAGVIEPAKVAISALENAASVASMILTTECLVTDAPKPEGQPQPVGVPGMIR